MSQPKSLAELKLCCTKKDKLRSVSKETIEKIILNEVSDNDDPEYDTRQLLKTLTKEMVELKESNREIVKVLTRMDALENMVDELRADNKICHQVIDQQQRFLESLDARERDKNVIVTGISETSQDMGVDDESRLTNVLEKLTLDIPQDAMDIKRLGKPNIRNKRPILVSFRDKQTRNSVIEKARLLKDSDMPYNRVYIKKDIHPALRREYDRLRKSEREEKQKPENQGKLIQYDHKERVITCDGLVIDRFNPSFF